MSISVSPKWLLELQEGNSSRLFWLLALATAFDLLLFLAAGTNLLTLRRVDLEDHPGRVAIFVVGYLLLVGVVMPWVSAALYELLSVPMQWAHVDKGDSRRNPNAFHYVSHAAAIDRLARKPDPKMLASVQAQMANRRRQLDVWHKMTTYSLACVVFLLADWYSGASMHLLAQWNLLAAISVIALAACPFGRDLWAGPPGHDFVLWPDLAREIQQAKIPSYLAQNKRLP